MPTNKPLRLLCWEGYDAPDYLKLLKTQGIELDVETLLSDAAAAQRLIVGDHRNWDLININNAYVRNCLEPKGLIKPLEADQFSGYADNIHPIYQPLMPWSYNSQSQLIGIGQRFGPFNLVVNTDVLSIETAQDQGFKLANNADFNQRYGILDYPDFNAFHFCIGAGLNPFEPLIPSQLLRFEQLAQRWYSNAKQVETDHHILNQALVDGEIDFYISGGVYTASPARLAGHQNIRAITPNSGPINGKGGIVFSEINSVFNHEGVSPNAERFLHTLLQPEAAIKIAFIDGTCNPVAQMGDPQVFKAFTTPQLSAIQWEGLAEDLSRCAAYQIPPNNTELLAILAKHRPPHVT
ncbi:MAG: spermidine/putrescine transport system substrate-binding protein [Saprospiraceae bacterium]|jgi:spermidine/putrescine transport system substrate-binding protein